MRIREAICADAEALARVKTDTWRTAYCGIVPEAALAEVTYAASLERWRRAFAEKEPNACLYVAEEEAGAVVGYARGGPERGGDPVYKGELYAIYILEAHQGRGLGRQMVRWVVEHLAQAGYASMLVWCLAENRRARTFYERLGGQYLRDDSFEMGGEIIPEVAYGWINLRDLLLCEK